MNRPEPPLPNPWWSQPRSALASPPPVIENLSPVEGWGLLTWYENLRSPGVGVQVSVYLEASPWYRTGLQPFAWDYVAPVRRPPGVGSYPVLRIVAARSVRITQSVRGRDGFTRRVPAGSLPKGAGLVSDSPPDVEIYRPQDNGLVPQPGEPIEPHRIFGPSYVIAPPGYRLKEKSVLRTLQVRPQPRGALVTWLRAGVRGEFVLRIEREDDGAAAAFAFDYDPEEFEIGGIVRVVHSRGVKVHVRVREGRYENLFQVLACETKRVEQVPPQGAALAERSDLRFEEHDVDELVPDPSRLRAIAALETLIGFVPIVGVLYDIGQLVYAAATGKSFFGYTVTDEELVLMGLTAAIPLAVGATSKALTKTVRATKLEAAVDDQALAAIRPVADSGFVEAVQKLTTAQIDEHAQGIQRHLADPRGTPLAALVKELNGAVGDPYLETLERRLLEKVFTEDFRGFRHPELSAAYNRYLSSARLRRNPELASDPATWAKRQSATRGAARLLLRGALGDDYVDVVNRATRQNTLPRAITKADVDNYDKLVRRGVEDYGTLRNEARKLSRVGDYFEIDHLLEQRFWRNNPNLRTAFDEEGSGMAFVVPKNAAVAKSMFLQFGGERIRYVHTLKTRGIRQLIPNGAEAFFSVQQIWLAHVHVLTTLGVDPSLFRRLARDFRLMANELGETLRLTPLPTPADFTPERGWPRVARNPDGSWTVQR